MPGLRTQKVVNGVKHEYYYVDGLLVYENIGDENLMYYRYDQNGTVIAINRIRLSDGATGLLYPVTNSRGDVVELRNGSGVLNAKYTYDSWGKLISITDANGNPVSEDSLAMFNSIRYRGYVYDAETGLYYLQSRYYDPETGRFLNADGVDFIGYSGEVLSYNVFAYCENNAVNCIDFFGGASTHCVLAQNEKTLNIVAKANKIFTKSSVFKIYYIRQIIYYKYRYTYYNSPSHQLKYYSRKNETLKLRYNSMDYRNTDLYVDGTFGIRTVSQWKEYILGKHVRQGTVLCLDEKEKK